MLLIKYHESLISEEYCFLENNCDFYFGIVDIDRASNYVWPERLFSYQTGRSK